MPESLVFVVPVKGLVTDAFKAEPSHYGIDIAAPQNSPVVATLAGTVVVAEWTPTTGYVLGIQHRFGLVSFYRHNAQLFKKVGENVVAGEAVASVGSTGDLSSGPHLHFELWHGGTPLNPTVYMKF